jgi:cytoplasmic iron level regulating protein YaaA (DUF328/UPF0246 family)
VSQLYLVSCVAKKSPAPTKAADLYRSSWFLKARAFAERRRARWLILSAKYGVVEPLQDIAPYEKTLNEMKAPERRTWAEGVLRQLEPHLAGIDEVVFLAGVRYREHLVPALQARGIRVSVPMEGLTIGRQLAWLGAHS